MESLIAPLAPDEVAGLQAWLAQVKARVVAAIDQPRYHQRFRPAEALDCHYLYLRAPSKAIRPALLLSACEAVGGDPDWALPAACAVEVFHTWSLVHDDILDRDDLRRGRPTVHAYFRRQLESEAAFCGPLGPSGGPGAALAGTADGAERERLAQGVAILVGDNLLAFSLALMNELALDGGPSAGVAAALVSELATEVTNGLIDGEMRDVLFEKRPLASLSVEACLDMLAAKTACLLEFCMTAGVRLGLGRAEAAGAEVEAARRYARHCGLAFQLQDDLLGLEGDVATLRKPVGADIRAGKRTPIVLQAYAVAGARDRQRLEGWLGDPDLSDGQVGECVEMLEGLGALEWARGRARGETARALEALEVFGPSAARERLGALARFFVQRAG